MTLLTLLGDENAWVPSSKICPVSAKEMPHFPLPTCPPPTQSCSPPTQLYPEYCPGPTAPLPLPQNGDRSLCSQFWLWDLQATIPSMAGLSRAPQSAPTISLHSPTSTLLPLPPTWPGLASVLSNDSDVLVT